MDDSTQEEFRRIPSLDYKYEVNSIGTVIRNVATSRPLKVFKKSHNSTTEYLCTQINLNKRVRKVFLHRVVAECWIGEKPEGLQVDHIDQNSLNNDYRNLRYVTKSEQMLNRNYDKFASSCLANLAKSSMSKGEICPVVLHGSNGESFAFPTSRKAARFLVRKNPEVKMKSITDKMYLRRASILGYSVEYLPPKRAEERDRVKHSVPLS